MAELISIFEAGDEERLSEYVDGLSNEETKDQLRAALAKLKQFKQMEAEDD